MHPRCVEDPMTTTLSASIPSERFVALVGLLNRECTLVERLLFKLTEVEMLATAGESRFMGLMVDEVESVSGELGAVELARGILVADLAHRLGLEADDTPLSELIPYAPQDTAGSLVELRHRLSALAGDLEMVGARGTGAVHSRLGTVRSALDNAESSHQARPGHDRAGDVMPQQVDHGL